jgi:hypothetical protein
MDASTRMAPKPKIDAAKLLLSERLLRIASLWVHARSSRGDADGYSHIAHL